MILFVVYWWTYQTPFGSVFTNEEAAKAAASVRNGVMLTITGSDIRIDGVDYYRRDNKGEPMPIDWRDLDARSTAAAVAGSKAVARRA